MAKQKVSIGICAYNEEANIGALLDSLIAQELVNFEICEIIVVSSASEDETDSIVEEYSKIDSKIRLIREKERKGKAHAVNTYLQEAEGDICVIQSGDTLATPKTIEALCSPINSNSGVGAVGGRIIPIDGRRFFYNFANRFIWEIYSMVSAKFPKLGEISAHKNIIESIPIDATSDDTFIEYAVTEAGYSLAYAPKAIIHNRGPDNFREYFRQRTRWRGAQLKLARDTNYKSASSRYNSVNIEVAKYILRNPLKIPFILAVCTIEVCSILNAKRMLKRDINSFNVWNPIESTKRSD